MSFHKYSRIDSLEVQIAALNFRVELLEESLGIQSPKPMVKTASRVASGKRATRQVPGAAGRPLRPDAPLYIPPPVQSKDSSTMEERPTTKEPPAPKKTPATRRPRAIRRTTAPQGARAPQGFRGSQGTRASQGFRGSQGTRAPHGFWGSQGTRASQRNRAPKSTRKYPRTRVPKRTRGSRKTPGSKATPAVAEKPAPGEKPAAHPDAAEPKTQSIPYQASAKKPLPNRPERQHFAFIQTLQKAGKNKEEIFARAMEAFPDLCKGQGLSEKARTTAVRNTVEFYTSSWAERYDSLD